jgi:pyruvate kinase
MILRHSKERIDNFSVYVNTFRLNKRIKICQEKTADRILSDNSLIIIDIFVIIYIMSTKVITTLGPASGNPEVLQYFKEHSVEIARLNGSHGVIEEHLRIAKLATNAGLDLMLDLPGPKIRLGEIHDKSLAVKTGEKVIIEKEKGNKDDSSNNKTNGMKILPCQFPIEKSTKVNDIVYIDDGKLQFRVLKVENNRIQAEALNNGSIKSHKGVNLPCKFV